MSIAQRLRAAWARRFALDDACGAFIVSVPATASQSTGNPLQKVKGTPVDHAFADILGGWKSLPQESSAGLNTDKKTGKVLVPDEKVSGGFNQLKSWINSTGTTCSFNGEQVKVTLVDYDSFAKATVIDFEHVDK